MEIEQPISSSKLRGKHISPFYVRRFFFLSFGKLTRASDKHFNQLVDILDISFQCFFLYTYKDTCFFQNGNYSEYIGSCSLPNYIFSFHENLQNCDFKDFTIFHHKNVHYVYGNCWRVFCCNFK